MTYRKEPLLFSLHPAQLCALPSSHPVDQEILKGFLRTAPMPHTQAPVP